MKHSNKLSRLVELRIPCCLLTLLIICAVTPAQARLGEQFAAYRARLLRNYSAAGQKGNNYFFKLKLTPQQQQIAPGYAAGLTVTVAGDRVTGESMAFFMGRNNQLGCTLATLDAFAFTCEATGKLLPQDKKQGELEFTAFTKIVKQAFDGHVQTYAYPGYPGTIVISLDRQEKLIVACSEQQPAAPKAIPTSLTPGALLAPGTSPVPTPTRTPSILNTPGNAVVPSAARPATTKHN